MSPLCAVSLYCATTVYVHIAEFGAADVLNEKDYVNLQTILQAMLQICHMHPTVRHLVVLACHDVERVGLRERITLPSLDSINFDSCGGFQHLQAPLFIRASLSKYKETGLVQQLLGLDA